MTEMRPLTMFLSGLFVLELNVLLATQQESAPAPAVTREKHGQLPPTPGQGREIYIPGIRPFLWEHHGAAPYFPVPNRDTLLELSKKSELIKDLTEQGFAQKEAEYLQRAFANAKSYDSVITETQLSVGTPLQKMRFRNGVKDMVILAGKSEEAWQVILPPELGSRVVWLPKVCGNICLSPFPAQTQTFVFKTEVKERERIREKIVEKPVPVYVPQPVYYPVDRPVYQEPGCSYSRCGRKCKIVLGVLAGVGAGAGVYFGTRGRGKRQQTVIPYKPPGGGGGVN
jgi:hypothetical protein